MMASEILLNFFGIFLLGLGLNLTPCVYPMLSVTVSVFRSQKETSRAHAFLRALVYVLGMAVIYSTLGVVSALTGTLFGAALQSKWVLISIGILMIGLAASLFGWYVIQAPSWLTRLAGKRTSGWIGIFLSGLFVGVFAAPCIGPLILALIAVVAQKGDPVFAFHAFFILSLGLGLPYLILGTFVGLVNRLPKSGVWLVWIDRLFGVLLLSTAAFYFILALRPTLLPWLIPSALFLGGLYLGFVEKAAAYSASFLKFKQYAGTAAILAGILIPLLAPGEGVIWEKYEASKLEQALRSHRPVVMNFYADWCLPCHELDRFTYTDSKVIELLEGFTRLKVDLTSPDEKAAALAEQYEILGVPTIVFLDRQGQEVQEARITGFLPPGKFAEMIKKVSHETDSQPAQPL